jgi:hypothetical protein
MPTEKPKTKKTVDMLIMAYNSDIDPTRVIESKWAIRK